MPTSLELTVVPLHRRAGQDLSYLPGVLAAEAPRRAARGRSGERVVLQLSAPSEHTLSPDAQTSLLQDMVDGYYRTAGAVTSALREQIERLNAYFVQRNRQGTPAAALFSMVSVREQRVTLAQCGPVQAFLLGDDIQHFFDPQLAGRGLGMGQTTDIRFFQFEMEPGQYLMLLPELPSGWNEKTLSEVRGQKLSTLRRRFLSEAGAELRAVLVSAQAGKPKLHLLSGLESEPAAAPVKVAPVRGSTQPRTQAWEAVETPTEIPAQPETDPAAATPAESTQEVAASRMSAEEFPAVEEAEPRPNPIAAATERARNAWQKIAPPVGAFLQRIMPEEPIFNLPPRVMGLIAILVPIVVVILVAVVYLQFGREQLYVNYLERAQGAAAIAAASTDADEIRQAWTGVVYYAERAAAYEKDQQTAAELLAQARAALDALDAIRRVEFVPALFAPLALDARITRMVATNNEIYMLNETDGKVLRYFLAGDGSTGGYQLDESFVCEPGPYGDFIVSNLVDLALLPRGNALDAALLAMDGNGNVIYCTTGERPAARALVPPDNNWGQPQAIAIENGNLYVLDPLTNAVWMYTGDGYSYADEPRFFFGAEVPNLRRVQDLALEGDDLYLLSQDGHMAVCAFSDDIDDPTTCEDPAQYTDTRLGRQSGATIEGGNFEEVQIGEPPQPALYLMDPVARAVYRLSLTLNLDTQFQSSTLLPEGLATAFAVTPNRAIIIAIEDEIFIGFMPSDS